MNGAAFGAQSRDGASKTQDLNRLAYRARILPTQLERARRRVAALEREAREYGFTDLLEQGA